MANDVFANMMEVSCKAAAGKSICAFPDVCFTPPTAPPTPPGVPIPYPNTGMASDCTSGSRTVKISGKEVMLKNKSYFKKSTGDEAGCAPKKGVVTSKNMGKVYFNMWSMDVKVEGENVVRNLDLTTHNHASVPGNTPTWPYIDDTYVGVDVWSKCRDDMGKEEKACKEFKPRKEGGVDPCDYVDNSLVATPEYLPGGKVNPDDVTKPDKKNVDKYSESVMADECLKARRCMLQPYDKSEKGKGGCCNGQTGHHLVEASGLMEGRTKKKGQPHNPSILKGTEYDEAKAPCVCLEGVNQYQGTHGLMHTYQSTAAIESARPGTLTFVDSNATESTKTFEKTTTYGEAKAEGLQAMGKVFNNECDPKCIEAQLDAYHNQAGIYDDTPCKSVITGHYGDDWVKAADAKVDKLNAKAPNRGAAAGA